MQGARDEHEFFAPEAVARTRTIANCEGMNRLGFYLSFFAGTASAGIDALGVFSTDNEASREMIGSDRLCEMFDGEGGQRFLEACEYLNVKKKLKRTAEETQAHLRHFFEFVGEGAESLHGEAVKLVGFSARLYLFAVGLIELFSLVSSVEHWADSVPRATHPENVAQWKAEPHNFDAFIDAAQACFEERLAEERAYSDPGETNGPRYRTVSTQPAAVYRSHRVDEDNHERPARHSVSRAGAPDVYGWEAAGSFASSDACKRGPSPPSQWPKKRVPSAPLSPTETRYSRRAARGEGEERGRTKAPNMAGDTDRPEKRLRAEEATTCDPTAWPVEEVHELEAQAQKIAVDADMAEMEATKVATLLDNIPAELREHNKLPTDTAGYKMVAKTLRP